VPGANVGEIIGSQQALIPFFPQNRHESEQCFAGVDINFVVHSSVF